MKTFTTLQDLVDWINETEDRNFFIAVPDMKPFHEKTYFFIQPLIQQPYGNVLDQLKDAEGACLVLEKKRNNKS